jgi:hypothetical protein
MRIQTIKTKTTLLIYSFLIALGLTVFASVSVSNVSAQTDLHNNVCGGANLNLTPSGEDGCTQDSHANPLTNLISQIIEVFSVIVGIVAVIMIIWGGFKFITSGGDSGNVTSARNTILYALIGLVIVALAQIIVRFVLTKTPS